jgi:hypothetical protein
MISFKMALETSQINKSPLGYFSGISGLSAIGFFGYFRGIRYRLFI